MFFENVAKVLEALESGEVKSGKGLNQELAFKGPGKTRWSSHYHALANSTLMYSSIIEVVEIIVTSTIVKKSGKL